LACSTSSSCLWSDSTSLCNLLFSFLSLVYASRYSSCRRRRRSPRASSEEANSPLSESIYFLSCSMVRSFSLCIEVILARSVITWATSVDLFSNLSIIFYLSSSAWAALNCRRSASEVRDRI
jgi:hypothetical protein